MDPRSRLVALAGTVDARSLAEGAFWIAAEAHPGLDVQHWLGRLMPDTLEEIRDRGTLHAHLGRGAAAVRDWETYLQRAPEAPDAGHMKDRLRALRQALASRN